MNPMVSEEEMAIQQPEQVGSQAWGTAALEENRDARRLHQTKVATARQHWIDDNRYYYDGVRRALRFVIEPGRRVLNVRCQTGHFLAALQPSRGVGVEISDELVEVARDRYPEYEFFQGDPEKLQLDEEFDYVLFNDVADTVDVLEALKRLRSACTAETRLVIYGYNRLWQPVLKLADKLGLRVPQLELNWLSENDIRGLLKLAGFEPLNTYRVMMFPKWIPLVSTFFNRFVSRLPGLSKLCLATVFVARPEPRPRKPEETSVSIIIPCRNERGNIEPAVERIPEMGGHTEIIFCDDQSTDGTGDEIRRVAELYPHRDIRLVEGPGICKAENVWTGFRAATGDVLMILDGDLAVMPEELPNFFSALVEGKAEFVNGSRLVYPVPRAAMKLPNLLGNKAFSLVFSYLLAQQIKDTLCGTKVLWRSDWQRIERLLGSWGVEDRWGDYELLFGAAKLQLSILDMPVHYQERVYGMTKMTRVFWNGVRMLRMCVAAGVKLKGGY